LAPNYTLPFLGWRGKINVCRDKKVGGFLDLNRVLICGLFIKIYPGK